MMKYLQSVCKELGDKGCYVFCLLDLAREVTGRTYDVFAEIDRMVSSHAVYYKKAGDPDNFYVIDPCEVLRQLTGMKWSVEKVPAPYTPSKDEYTVEWWSIDGVSGHFARTAAGYNSLESSRNVSEGSIRSYRVFTHG